MMIEIKPGKKDDSVSLKSLLGGYGRSQIAEVVSVPSGWSWKVGDVLVLSSLHAINPRDGTSLALDDELADVAGVKVRVYPKGTQLTLTV
jgi:hypothetical protein